MGGPEAVETQRLMAVTAALVAALAASLHAATAAPPHVISVIVDECVPTPDPTPKAESHGVKRVSAAGRAVWASGTRRCTTTTPS